MGARKDDENNKCLFHRVQGQSISKSDSNNLKYNQVNRIDSLSIFLLEFV